MVISLSFDIQGFEIAWLKHMKSAHAGVLKKIIDSGYDLSDDVAAELANCAEEFTEAYTPPAVAE